MPDLACGCWIGPPKTRPCRYHDGREDERDIIVQYLRRFPDNRHNEVLFDVADSIEAGAHIDGGGDHE